MTGVAYLTAVLLGGIAGYVAYLWLGAFWRWLDRRYGPSFPPHVGPR